VSDDDWIDEEGDPDEDGLGPPVDLSGLLGGPAESAFMGRIRRSIERRQVSADFASFFWSLPGTLLRGFLWSAAQDESTKVSKIKPFDGDPHG